MCIGASSTDRPVIAPDLSSTRPCSISPSLFSTSAMISGDPRFSISSGLIDLVGVKRTWEAALEAGGIVDGVLDMIL